MSLIHSIRRPQNRSKVSRTPIKSVSNTETSVDEHDVVRLQRLIGNQAVMRMIEKGELNVSESSSNHEAVAIQRKVMTSSEFLSMGGEAKQDIALGGLTLKKQSSKYKEIVTQLDKYHRLVNKVQLTSDLMETKRSLKDSYNTIQDLGTSLYVYIRDHDSERNPNSPRNKAVLLAKEQVDTDRLIFEGLLIITDIKDWGERYQKFMTTGNGKGLTTLRDLIDRAPSTPDHAAIGKFFGLQ